MKHAALWFLALATVAYITGLLVAHNLAEATGFVFGEVR